MDLRFLEREMKKLEEGIKQHEKFTREINSDEYNKKIKFKEYQKHYLQKNQFTPKELEEYLLSEGFTKEILTDGSKAYSYHSRLLILLKGRGKLPKKINVYVFQKRLGSTSYQIFKETLPNMIDEIKKRISQYKASILETKQILI